MKYEVFMEYREWEIVAEYFDFDKLYQGLYDNVYIQGNRCVLDDARTVRFLDNMLVLDKLEQ